MKILMLTPYLPYPLYSGCQIRSYNLLKHLSVNHKITLFSFIREEKERVYAKSLKKFCQKVVLIKRRRAWDLRNIFLSILTPYPFLVAIYLSRSLRRRLTRELASANYDLIHAETFYVMPNLPAVSAPVLLVEQTIEHLVYQRFVENFKFAPLKPLLYFDVFKIKLWEKYFWQKASRLAAMSEADKKIMAKTVKDKPVDVVANGVDIDYFAKTPSIKGGRLTVLFVGNFKWLPNKDAALFLTRKIWPKIKQKLPRTKLWIVGRNPTTQILALKDQKDVNVTGDLKDIRQAFSRASVLLAPIRNGRGTKYKVLEAMASSVPVVTTALGIEGIAAKNNQAVLVAETASDLAQKTLKLLTRPKLAKKISSNAKKLILSRYNWKIISQDLDKIYQEMGKN